MTQAQLTRLCKKWQKRLRLLDWKITPLLVPTDQLPDNHWARNEWEDEEFWSKISILEGLTDQETESHLVHEMLHIRMNDWDCEYGDPKQERVINLLTDCFLMAYPHRKVKQKIENLDNK